MNQNFCCIFSRECSFLLKPDIKLIERIRRQFETSQKVAYLNYCINNIIWLKIFMPVVRPHNKQKISRKNTNQQKKSGQKNNKDMRKQSKSRKKDEKNVTDVQSEGELTVLAHQKNDRVQNSKKTIKKINLEEKPMIKDLKKRLKKYSQQYTPDYLFDIINFLIEKQKNKSFAITNEKVSNWRQIRKNEMMIEGSIRKEVERIRELIKRERNKRSNKGQQMLDNISDGPSLSLSSSTEVKSMPSFNVDLRRCWEDSNRFNLFASLINQILICCEQSDLMNSIFPSCYFFYMLTISDSLIFQEMSSQLGSTSNRTQELIEYYFSVSLFISSKYHQIQPISIEQLIFDINQSLTVRKAEKIELIAMELNNFSEFYSDHEGKFLDIMCLLANWGELEKKICLFILQSGLNNPKLYEFSPMHKAAVVMGIYEQTFMKTQETFIQIRSIFQGPSIPIGRQIKKLYLSILEYNTLNNFNYQKDRHYIVQSDFMKLMSLNERNLIKK